MSPLPANWLYAEEGVIMLSKPVVEHVKGDQRIQRLDHLFKPVFSRDQTGFCGRAREGLCF